MDGRRSPELEPPSSEVADHAAHAGREHVRLPPRRLTAPVRERAPRRARAHHPPRHRPLFRRPRTRATHLRLTASRRPLPATQGSVAATLGRPTAVPHQVWQPPARTSLHVGPPTMRSRHRDVPRRRDRGDPHPVPQRRRSAGGDHRYARASPVRADPAAGAGTPGRLPAAGLQPLRAGQGAARLARHRPPTPAAPRRRRPGAPHPRRPRPVPSPLTPVTRTGTLTGARSRGTPTPPGFSVPHPGRWGLHTKPAGGNPVNLTPRTPDPGGHHRAAEHAAWVFYAIAALGSTIGQIWVGVTTPPWPADLDWWWRAALVAPFAAVIDLGGVVTSAFADARQRLGETAYDWRILS